MDGRVLSVSTPLQVLPQPPLMKATLLSIAIALATPALFGQQPGPLPPLISTNGSAQIRVVPDLADLYFEVEVRNADLTVARKQQAERATKVLAALRAAGVVEADLQSSQVQIAPDYTDRRQETEKIKFYRVSQSICCTLHDLKKVPDVTTEAVTAGATGVREASLRTSQLRKFRDEARAAAIHAAKEKAASLATELGAKVGKPYTITEGPGTDWRSNYTSNSSTEGEQPGDGTTPAFAPGTISITASVNVSFILE
jgi:uncharacterized protein YggE